MMWRRWLIILSGALIISIGLYWWDWARLPIHIQQNQQAQAEHPAKQGSTHPEKTFWERTTDDPIAVFNLLLVVFTGVLAVSTIGLGIATYKLWRTSETHAVHMEQSVKTAQKAAAAASLHAQAAISVELPAIFVTNVALHASGTEDLATRLKRRVISITFQNFGRTPAFLVRSSATVVVSKDLPESPSYTTIVRYPPGTLIERGHPYTMNLPPREYNALQVEDIINGIEILWVYGFVSYRDFIKRCRKIGFCARLFCSSRPDAINEFRFGYCPEGYTYDQ